MPFGSAVPAKPGTNRLAQARARAVRKTDCVREDIGRPLLSPNAEAQYPAHAGAALKYEQPHSRGRSTGAHGLARDHAFRAPTSAGRLPPPAPTGPAPGRPTS